LCDTFFLFSQDGFYKVVKIYTRCKIYYYYYLWSIHTRKIYAYVWQQSKRILEYECVHFRHEIWLFEILLKFWIGMACE